MVEKMAKSGNDGKAEEEADAENPPPRRARGWRGGARGGDDDGSGGMVRRHIAERTKIRAPANPSQCATPKPQDKHHSSLPSRRGEIYHRALTM